MKPKIDIRNSLKKHRVLADGMTQQELAERVGVTRQTILSIEKGRYQPTVGLALRLAASLEVAVEELFWLKGDGLEPSGGGGRVFSDEGRISNKEGDDDAH